MHIGSDTRTIAASEAKYSKARTAWAALLRAELHKIWSTEEQDRERASTSRGYRKVREDA